MKLLTLCFALLTLQAGAQTIQGAFTITPERPLPGSSITIAYKDKGTILEGKKAIRAVVYSFSHFKWQADDVALVHKDSLWTGSFLLPDGCALISCIFQADTLTDKGGSLTYSWLMSDANRKQLPGAFYGWGLLRSASFWRQQPFAVDSTALKPDEVTRMWCRYEVRDHPDSKPYIFKTALTLYKKQSTDAATDDNIRKEVSSVLSMPNLNEEAFIDAQYVYTGLLHDKPAGDSIEQLILNKFPKGITARDKLIVALTRETDQAKKIKGIEQLLIDFPPQKFNHVVTPVTDLYYNKLFRTLVYIPIMKDSDYTNLFKYLPAIPTSELSTTYHHMVEIPYEQKKMPLPVLLRLSDSLYQQIMRRPPDGIYSPLQWKALNGRLNAISFFTHAQLLYESKQIQKALAVAGLVNSIPNLAKTDFKELYVRLLLANDRKQEVMPYLLQAAQENALTPYMLELLKKDYIAHKNKKGEGFDTWIESLKSKEKTATDEAKLKKALTDLPIAPFRLESAKGDTVDLNQLKGKIVVLDFWATWCGPCKAAMPGMQMAVNKYKTDASVAFYFIATQEVRSDYREAISRFMAEKKYPFEVLYDGYNKETKHLDKAYARYASDYHSSGIPMKLIIDQKGRLRWINFGYMGSPSGLADEISFIIDSLKREQAAMPQNNTSTFNSETIHFYNADSSIRFGGTLTMPANGHFEKAMVLVSGTGKQDRDGTMAGHKLFAVIASHCTNNGIAVLRVDDRGTGETTGIYENATTQDFAQDALLAVKYLRSRADVKNKPIGLLGHSEGGAAITMAAAADTGIKFLISLSGLASKGIDALVAQNEQLVAMAPITPLDKKRHNELNNQMFKAAYQYANDTILGTKLREAYAAWKIKDDQLVDSLHIAFDHFRFPVEYYIQQATGPWYRFHVRFDPAPYIGRLHIPVLAIYGEKDIMLNAVANAANWKKYAPAATIPTITTTIMPGLNHLLQHCQTCTVEEYAKIAETISTDVLTEITNWLKTKN